MMCYRWKSRHRDANSLLAREEWRIVPSSVVPEGAAGAQAQLNGVPETFPVRAGCRAAAHHHGGGVMHIDRVHADRYLAFLGFALSVLFLLAIVAFAFTVNDVPTVETVAK